MDNTINLPTKEDGGLDWFLIALLIHTPDKCDDFPLEVLQAIHQHGRAQMQEEAAKIADTELVNGLTVSKYAKEIRELKP